MCCALEAPNVLIYQNGKRKPEKKGDDNNSRRWGEAKLINKLELQNTEAELYMMFYVVRHI